jgi:signal transduction histidine kinase
VTLKERTLREEAEQASAVKDRFLAVLSHELRTPLTPALMLAEAGKLDNTLPATAREDFGTIAANIRLEVQLIGDLLDVTRIRYVTQHCLLCVPTFAYLQAGQARASVATQCGLTQAAASHRVPTAV